MDSNKSEKQNLNNNKNSEVNLKDLSASSNDYVFEALVDSAPLITSAVSSADGKSIVLTFSLSPSPILPAVFPQFFDVKFDGISVPIIDIKRDFVNFKNDCIVATTSSFSNDTVTYNNGTLGVGATLTGPQEVLIIDGVTLSLNDRILVKSYVGSNSSKNGIYRLSTVGVASTTNWILTRTTDADTEAELKNLAVYITDGSATNIGAWSLGTLNTITIGTTNLTFTKQSEDAGNVYIIRLAMPIKPNIDVSIDYFPGATDYVTNNKVSPNAMVAIEGYAVDVSTLEFPYGLFDPIFWASNDFAGSLPNGIIYENRIGFLTPPIVYDVESAFGEIVLHQDATKLLNGINIHYFGCYSTNNDTETSANLLSGTYFVQDVFSNTIREANTLGGSDSPNDYETVGDNYKYSLVHYLSTTTAVKSIEFGITATNPKNYVIEVKKTSTSSWVQLMYMYASDGTLEFFRYVFQTALSLYAVRIRYRGDFYYQVNEGITSVSALDLLSGNEAIRLSHFTDFRDAEEFQATLPSSEWLEPQAEGWVAFTDGNTTYDWNLVNESRVWDLYTSVDETVVSPQPTNKIFDFKGRFLSVVNNKIYSIDTDGLATMVYDASATTINVLKIHNNKLYVGLENGSVLVSTNGLTFTSPIILTGLPPVKSLETYANVLWIGTGLDANSIGYLYRYNEVSLVRRSFGNYQIKSLGKTSKFLFIGLGSDISGSQKGIIWYTNGTSYTPLFNTLQDRVDTIEFNSGTGELWFGASDGSIYAIKFDGNGNITSYSRIKQLGANTDFKFLSFRDSPDKKFFWMVSTKTDGNVFVYNVNLNIYFDTFRPSNVSIQDVAYFNNNVYGIGSDGQIYQVDLNIFSTEERNVYLQTRDLAGNVNTTAYSDNIVFGIPLSTATVSSLSPGKIYQIKVPTVYLKQSTTTEDNLTYTATKKWTSNDSIQVYLNNESGVTSETYTNLNNGSIVFASALNPTDKVFVTITSPADGMISLANTYDSPIKTSPLFAPSKITRDTGIYESEPFYAPSLNRWNELAIQAHFASTSPAVDGGESGLQIDIYVRADTTRDKCLEKDWGLPFTYSTINTTSALGIIFRTFSIHAYSGKWLQFKAVLSTASINVSPKLNYVALSYFSANDTYFFTKRFDTATEQLTEPYPEIRRGLLTYNGSANGGNIQFKYLASDDINDSFEIAKYTDIEPNSIFELSSPSRYIRFAVLLVSAGDILDPDTAAILDEFAIQLESGSDDLYWMNPDIPAI